MTRCINGAVRIVRGLLGEASLHRVRAGRADPGPLTGAALASGGIAIFVPPSALAVLVASIAQVDVGAMLMHVEPAVPMDELALQALAYGVVPQVVLEFPGITVGGALSGGAACCR